jgi:ABC-type nitrate/sulfonate/bicarbonate transport system substrate-binding protein
MELSQHLAEELRMASMSRRRFTGMLGAIGGAAALGSPLTWAQQKRSINFITPFGYLIGFAPTFNAQAGGHFAKEGLDVAMLPGKGSAVAVQQVIAGRAAYGRGDPLAVVKAVSEGAPVVAFATVLHRSPIVVYSSPSRPIRGPQDMVGKVIGIAAKGSASDNILDLMLANAGLAPDSVRREAVGNSPGGWGLIQQGRIDAHIVSIGTTTSLTEAGEKILVWNTSDAVPMPGQAYFALRESLQKEPDLFVRILRAERASIQEIRRGDGRALVERMSKLWEIEGAKEVNFTVKAMRDEEQLWWRDNAAMLLKNDPASWKSMVDLMVKVGLIKSGQPSQFYTDDIVARL